MRALWRGELPLSTAFWTHAIVQVGLANLAATVGAIVTLLADGSAWLALAVHLAPLPYGVAAIVGVWRSAAREGAPADRAALFRGAAIAWVGLMLLV